MLLKASRTPLVRDMGGFIAHLNMPGWLLSKPKDHGHGPLAMVVESILAPGRCIAMHEHQNDEIISWVPEGVMRHEDRSGEPLVVDSDHLMIMNAGRSFCHSEETKPTDPQLRMLQIMVRPKAPDLAPQIQYDRLPPALPNEWRHVFSPEGAGALFFVRNELDFYDLRVAPGKTIRFPQKVGRDLYFYVFSGLIVINGLTFAEGEQGLLTGGGALSLEAKQESLVVAFLIDPSAIVTRRGTVGDHSKIPSPRFARPILTLLRFKRRWRKTFQK